MGLYDVQIERKDKSQLGKKESNPSIIGRSGNPVLPSFPYPLPAFAGTGFAGIQCYRHSRGSGNPVLLPTLIEKLRKKFLFFLDEFI
jgi:hypothetical protein